MYAKTRTYGKYIRYIYLLGFLGNLQIDFYVRLHAYEKRVTGKQP